MVSTCFTPIPRFLKGRQMDPFDTTDRLSCCRDYKINSNGGWRYQQRNAAWRRYRGAEGAWPSGAATGRSHLGGRLVATSGAIDATPPACPNFFPSLSALETAETSVGGTSGVGSKWQQLIVFMAVAHFLSGLQQSVPWAAGVGHKGRIIAPNKKATRPNEMMARPDLRI